MSLFEREGLDVQQRRWRRVADELNERIRPTAGYMLGLEFDHDTNAAPTYQELRSISFFANWRNCPTPRSSGTWTTRIGPSLNTENLRCGSQFGSFQCLATCHRGLTPKYVSWQWVRAWGAKLRLRNASASVSTTRREGDIRLTPRRSWSWSVPCTTCSQNDHERETSMYGTQAVQRLGQSRWPTQLSLATRRGFRSRRAMTEGSNRRLSAGRLPPTPPPVGAQSAEVSVGGQSLCQPHMAARRAPGHLAGLVRWEAPTPS